MSQIRDDKVKLILIRKDGKILSEWDWGNLEDEYFIWDSEDNLSIEIRKVIEREYKIEYEPDMCNQKHGQHTIHEAIYGSDDQFARWEGDEVSSGFFNEPPSREDEEIT